MTELRFAAQAIVAAFNDRYELLGPLEGNWEETCLVAALRALADAVVPEEPGPTGMRASVEPFSYQEHRRAMRQETRADILAIAAQLETTDD